MGEEPRPKQAIRRFDVFAEYNKLKAVREGRVLNEAKGYGLWLAKLVAARRFTPASTPKPPTDADRRAHATAPPEGHERFHSLGGEPQTDRLFDREIVARMGRAFYEEVFAPTIAWHFERGDSYESIRDAVRRNWKPARSSRPLR